MEYIIVEGVGKISIENSVNDRLTLGFKPSGDLIAMSLEYKHSDGATSYFEHTFFQPMIRE